MGSWELFLLSLFNVTLRLYGRDNVLSQVYGPPSSDSLQEVRATDDQVERTLTLKIN